MPTIALAIIRLNLVIKLKWVALNATHFTYICSNKEYS